MVTKLLEKPDPQTNDFVYGTVLSQEEQLRRRSGLYGNGTSDGAEREAEQEQYDEEYRERKAANQVLAWDAEIAALIAADSPYRNMTDPGSKYYYCYQAATPQEQQELALAQEAVVQAEQAVDISSQASPDGRPSAEAVVEQRIARTDEALAGMQMVINHGTPEHAETARRDSMTARERREYDRETRYLLGKASTKEEKLEILKQRSPELVAEMDRRAAAEMAKRNGSQINPNQASPSSGEPLPGQPVKGAILAPVALFNAAAQAIAAATDAVYDAYAAYDVRKYFNENRELLHYNSARDDLDNPYGEFSHSIWHALEKKPELVDNYDDAVDRLQTACDTAESTENADNFLALHQCIIDRKIAVNDIVLFESSDNGETDEYNQAQAERAKLVEGQKKLADLKTQMEGKSEAEKADLLRMVFPPDAEAGETLGLYDRYLAGEKETLSVEGEEGEPDTDCCYADCCDDDYYYFDEWVLSGGCYDTGSACSVYDTPGSGIKNPGLNLTQNFTALASAQPASNDSTTQAAPTSSLKPPSMLAA